ncbi:MAG: M23 family metallopeptidase, partial [Woeseiaceae bacterium]
MTATPTRAEDGAIRGKGFTIRRLALSLLLFCGTANATCHDGWVCIDEHIDGDTVLLRARNLKTFPVTYTLSVTARNYISDRGEPVTRTLRPQEISDAMTLTLRHGRRHNGVRHDVQWTIGDKDANHDDDHLYAFPYASGRSYRILQGFGSRFSHTGLEQYAIDFDMPEGTPVHAARSGIVAEVVERHSKGCWRSGCGRYANYIVVLHSDGTTGEYYHLQQDGALIDVGDSVARGQRIGYSGNTGNTALPHLHFAVYRASSMGETQSIP